MACFAKRHQAISRCFLILQKGSRQCWRGTRQRLRKMRENFSQANEQGIAHHEHNGSPRREDISQDEVLTAQAYSGPNSEYLGELGMVMSQPGLSDIARGYRYATKSIPSKSSAWPEPIGDCNKDCTVSRQLGVPCRHTIYSKLEAGMLLAKQDVHPRQHLREPISRNPYR